MSGLKSQESLFPIIPHHFSQLFIHSHNHLMEQVEAVMVEVEVKREVRVVVTELMEIQMLVTKYTGLDFIYLVKCR